MTTIQEDELESWVIIIISASAAIFLIVIVILLLVCVFRRLVQTQFAYNIGRRPRVMRFSKKNETKNCHEITDVTDSFDQLNYFDKNKQHILCVTLNIFI